MKEDSRRVKMTKTLLHKGLIEALRDKPLDKITVTEICDFADVNRSTYYSYFSDPFDQIIQYEKSIGESIRDQLEGVYQDNMSTQERCNSLFTAALKELGEIKDDFKVLVSGKVDLSIVKGILNDFWEPVFFETRGSFDDLDITEPGQYADQVFHELLQFRIRRKITEESRIGLDPAPLFPDRIPVLPHETA